MQVRTNPIHVDSVPVQTVARRVYDTLVHSSVFLGAATAGEVYVAATLAGVGPNAALFVGFLATVGVYNLDKLADLEADAANYAERVAFVSARPRLYAAASGLAVVGAVYLAVRHGGWAALGLTLFPGVIAVAYSLPVLPMETASRLKDVFLVNTAVVSLAWAVPVAFVPVATAGDAPVVGALVAAGWFFLRSAISVEVHNVRDVAGDRENGVDTLPTALGVARTKAVLYAMEVLSIVLVGSAAIQGYVPAWTVLALLPAVLLSVWVTRTMTDPNRDTERLCTVRDGEGFVMAVGILVGSGLFGPLV
jgi:4-hydroxybenzoate polyprenyltransferase